DILVAGAVDGSVLVYDASAGYRAAPSPKYLPELDRRLTADPNNQADWRVRAEIHARMKDWSKATEDIRRFLTLDREMQWCALDSWVIGPFPEDLQTSYSPERNPNPGP